jgi:hypothetical protein
MLMIKSGQWGQALHLTFPDPMSRLKFYRNFMEGA